MAAAVIVLIAAALVTAKVMRNGSGVPLASPGPVPVSSAVGSSAADATPRCYVRYGWVARPGNLAIVVGDVQTGKTLGSYNLPKGSSFVWAASGAADDRTFVADWFELATSRSANDLPDWKINDDR